MLLVCPGATRKDGRVRVTGAMVHHCMTKNSAW